jgi:hypothetical protein
MERSTAPRTLTKGIRTCAPCRLSTLVLPGIDDDHRDVDREDEARDSTTAVIGRRGLTSGSHRIRRPVVATVLAPAMTALGLQEKDRDFNQEGD